MKMFVEPPAIYLYKQPATFARASMAPAPLSKPRWSARRSAVPCLCSATVSAIKSGLLSDNYSGTDRPP